MKYKDIFEKEWAKSGGLINKATAAKLLEVSKSVMSTRKDIRKISIMKDEFVSYAEILNRDDIKPRKKRKKQND